MRWIVPIRGTTKPLQLKENIASFALDFAVGELREIDTAYTEIKVEGETSPEHLQTCWR